MFSADVNSISMRSQHNRNQTGKKFKRMLLVTHALARPEFGAGQVALNLAESLKILGLDVTLWSAAEACTGIDWWQQHWKARAALDCFLQSEEPFAIVDVPATLLTSKLAKSGISVVRSVQPELLYLRENLSFSPNSRSTVHSILQRIAGFIYSIYLLVIILHGWTSANLIICLGSIEQKWMRHSFPWWRNKIGIYTNTLSRRDQASIQLVRKQRSYPSKSDGIRFLWIGRWHPQKGVKLLSAFIVERLQSCPNDTITLAGFTSLPESIRFKDLVKSGRLKLVPVFNRDQLCDLLRQHDVGLVTSSVEGWGLSLNEMLESGMTVFSTPVGGFEDLKVFFPRTLRSFPPPMVIELESESNEQFDGYFEVFNWDSIALAYLEQITAFQEKRD